MTWNSLTLAEMASCYLGRPIHLSMSHSIYGGVLVGSQGQTGPAQHNGNERHASTIRIVTAHLAAITLIPLPCQILKERISKNAHHRRQTVESYAIETVNYFVSHSYRSTS